jgi:hypothetical protein
MQIFFRNIAEYILSGICVLEERFMTTHPLVLIREGRDRKKALSI